MAFKNFLFKKEEPVVKKQATMHTPTNIGIPPVMSAMPVNGIDYTKHLEDVMRKNNQSGLDYLEFADALNSLAGQPLSEQQKYIATFPSYAGMGVTVAKLVESANDYLVILAKEAADFKQEMDNSRNVGISMKNQSIEKIKLEIEQLTKQIQQKTGDIQKLTQEVNENTNTLSLADNNFNLAYGNRVAIIKDHISKIQNYLSNGTTTK